MCVGVARDGMGIVVQYGMESRRSPSRLEKSADNPHQQEG